MTQTYPVPVGVDEHDFATLLADRETLRRVTDELVTARLALRIVRGGLSKRVDKSLEDGAGWVRLDRAAARHLLAACERLGISR